MGRIKVYERISEIPGGQAGDKVQQGCLVLEGGAFRGLYTQGALDALMLKDINIHTVIGVSAGALSGMNYVSGQIGRSARANLGYRKDSRYIGLKALKKRHTIVDVGYLLYYFSKYDHLDKERLLSNDRHFVAVVTNCLTGKPMYCDKDKCSDFMEAIRASATMPYISPMVNVDGVPCLDGGCSCKIPYQWAIDNDFKKIVVIKTRERGFRKEAKEQKLAYKFYGKYPEFARELARSDEDYNDQCQELDELENAKRVYVIAPSTHVVVSRLERDLNKLGDLYWQGYNETMEQIDKIKEYLDT